MKLIYNFILISVLMLCPAFLRADMSSTAPDTVQSHGPETSMAAQILSDANSDTDEVAQKQPEFTPPEEKTIIVFPQGNEAEAKVAQEAAPAENETVTETEEEGPRIHDPLAPVNKVMYHFNDRLYFWR